MRYLYTVSVLPTVDGSQQAPSFEMQTGELALKLSNILLWMTSVA